MGLPVRMAELATRSGLSVATIKFYLREGLLPSGHRSSVNQAEYGERHLERLRMIRALAKVAGLPLARIREVVAVVDGGGSPVDAMAATQDALAGEVGAGPIDSTSESALDRVIAERGWRCEKASPAYGAAAAALAELEAEGFGGAGLLADYAEAAEIVGRSDVAAVAAEDSTARLVRAIVVGGALRRPLLDALVMLAQQHHAQFGRGPAAH